jgi:4'-phosphopantetheinyl transferase
VSAALIDIRLVDLDLLGPQLDEIDRHLNLLSDEERSWPESAVPEQSRRRRAARLALRLLLLQAGATGARGAPLQLDRHGKPELSGSAMAFNVSHSGGLALIALAREGPIGIDLEAPRRVALGPARQALIEAAGAVLGTPAPASELGFLDAWTRLEAFAKARGSGIGALLTELGITARGVRNLSAARAAARAGEVLAASELAVAPLALPGSHAGAVCAPAPLLAMPPAWRWLTREDAAVAG